MTQFIVGLGDGNVTFEKFGISGNSGYPIIREGMGYYAHFIDCYERLNITQSYALVGSNWNYSLVRCYTTTNCSVKQVDRVDSHYNKNNASNGPGIGLTTAQFANKTHFANWNFQNVSLNSSAYGTINNHIQVFGTGEDSLNTLINNSKANGIFNTNLAEVFYGRFAWK